jgi:BASS family bile acid:Na+ symporter
MQASIITNLLLPLSLAVIMFGLGLSLALADFRRVLSFPKAVLVGLFVQTVLLPGVAFLIAIGFGLAPALAVGLMLLAASPGGATANVYSHLARGDVALNITLTATNSLLCLATLPLIVSLSLAYFMGAEQYVPPPFRKVVEVGVIILGPVVLGMLVRAFAPRFALAAEKPLRIVSMLVLFGLMGAVIVDVWDELPGYIAAVGLACLVFNLASMAAGYWVPLAIRLPKRQAIAIAMEIGIHNGTLAIFVALNVLGDATMSVPAAIYSIIMFITAAVFGWWVNRRPDSVPA